MAEHWWPCPGCGQQQRKQAPQGEVVPVTLCAACAELDQEAHELAELVEGEAAHQVTKRKR